MTIECDPGYPDPFLALCRDYPGTDVYDPGDFRVEWGPIFHRGRLDGTARILVIGQDPAQNENVVRRILVGVAGQRAQGLLRKLGVTRSYVLINTYLYSVYSKAAAQHHAGNAGIVAYRNRWISAILASSPIEAVLTLGSLAQGAWSNWRSANPGDAKRDLPFAHVTHPTQPESSSGTDASKLAAATAALLHNWNEGVQKLAPAIHHPDTAPLGATYGTTWQDADIVPIPSVDLPAGTPNWMGNSDRWAARVGATAAARRANITITVPAAAMATTPTSPHVAVAHAGGVAAAGLALTAHAGTSAPASLALTGTVVTMTSPSRVMTNRAVYIADGIIKAIRAAGDPPPDGFAGMARVDTGGLIFPGLIELHNHLAYNALPLWAVPKKFADRDQWSGITAYRQLVSGPMGAISGLPGMLAAICRYVECKAMLGGATTSQGIALVNRANIRTFFRGLLRNAELTDDPSLPAAKARIGDVTAKDIDKFRKTLQKAKSCYLLHLSEGTDAAARSHFEALRASNGQWALSSKLAGIHSVALQLADFQIMAANEAAMVWSPLSNLLLYGGTADVASAKAAGLRIGIGPDWSPSGSKNLLGELKVARVYSGLQSGLFTDEELVAMATRVAASILGWQDHVGTIEEGKLADLLVVSGAATKPYASLLEATEADVRLLVIGGVRRFGLPKLMAGAGPDLETIEIGKKKRALNLWPTQGPEGDGPQLAQLTLAQATAALRDALAHLGEVSPATPHLHELAAATTGGWHLALDELEDTGFQMRTLAGLSPRARKSGVTRPLAAHTAVALAPIVLDPLTVPDDPGFLGALAKERNLPAGLAAGIAKLY
jgi:5-methylthioadenosine/S-adenosylhomocysteine deaminase